MIHSSNHPWLSAEKKQIKSFNIVTMRCHAMLLNKRLIRKFVKYWRLGLTLEELSLSNLIFVWLANMNDSLVRCNTSCEKCALLQNSKKSKLIHLKSQSWYQKHERNFLPKKLNINQTNFALDQKTFCGILKSNFFDKMVEKDLIHFLGF
jgi:hypothetical protein